MENKYCKTCFLRNEAKKVCQLTGIPIDLEADFCSKHIEDITNTCNICGQLMITPGFVEHTGDGVIHYCEQCYQALNTCQLCPNVRKCEFHTNPDPMPKVVVKTVRQGNMVMQTQVINEERVKKFCHECICWMGDGIDACGKEFNIGCCKQPDIFSSRKS